MFAGREHQPEGGLLGEFEGGVPVRVAGVDLHDLGFGSDLHARLLRIPGTGNGLPGEIKGTPALGERG